MPAPKNPNTRDATDLMVASRRRAKHEKWAAEMRADGYLVLAPDEHLEIREAAERANDRQIQMRRQVDEAMSKMGLAMRRIPVLVDPGHELMNSFYKVADILREMRRDMGPLRRVHRRVNPFRQCEGCGRTGGELTENGCPGCGPNAVIFEARSPQTQ